MKEKLLAAGGVVGAVGASACCVVPLGLASLGVGGAWVGSLTAFAPYQPFFIAFAVVCLGAGYWLVYRRRGAACATAGAGRMVKNVLWVKGALWLGTVVALLAVGTDVGGRLFL
jgi:mercuric ion transport protein